MVDVSDEMNRARQDARDLERCASRISEDVESLCAFLDDVKKKQDDKDAGVIKLIGSRWSHKLGGDLERRVVRVIEEHVEEQIEELERLTRRRA